MMAQMIAVALAAAATCSIVTCTRVLFDLVFASSCLLCLRFLNGWPDFSHFKSGHLVHAPDTRAAQDLFGHHYVQATEDTRLLVYFDRQLRLGLTMNEFIYSLDPACEMQFAGCE